MQMDISCFFVTNVHLFVKYAEVVFCIYREGARRVLVDVQHEKVPIIEPPLIKCVVISVEIGGNIVNNELIVHFLLLFLVAIPCRIKILTVYSLKKHLLLRDAILNIIAVIVLNDFQTHVVRIGFINHYVKNVAPALVSRLVLLTLRNRIFHTRYSIKCFLSADLCV